ncbi:MAG: hypothetical protein RIR77_970 [Planctomycetota bacterium]|jgi:hypothetical protein
MKNISTGTGLCVLGLCLASYPIIDRVMPRAEAGATHVAAVVAAATAQVPPEPTIVWYSWSTNLYNEVYVLVRAWSDGKVEMRRVNGQAGSNTFCSPTATLPCVGEWLVISDPNSGYNASADINFDSKVDGADLGQVLAMWGDAPRQDIPPSTCPLNLINP